MAPEGDNPRRDLGPAEVTAAIARFAAQRHGVLDLDELHRCGLGERGVQHRAAAGHLHRVHEGVYAVGHPGLSLDGRRRAAVLACGPDAALSHRSAGAVWGVCDDDPLQLHVTLPRSGRVAPTWVAPHTSRVLTPDDLRIVRQIAVTSVAWTLMDLAAELAPDELERVVHEAEVRRVLDVPSLRLALDRCPRRRGTRKLRRALDEGHGVTRSELEDRFRRLCRRLAVPTPRFNVCVCGFEVDVLWPAERVIVELDGARFHRTRRGFEADRRRDAALAAAGYVVVRLTWRRLAEEPVTVGDEIRRILALRASGPR